MISKQLEFLTKAQAQSSQTNARFVSSDPLQEYPPMTQHDVVEDAHWVAGNTGNAPFSNNYNQGWRNHYNFLGKPNKQHMLLLKPNNNSIGKTHLPLT